MNNKVNADAQLSRMKALMSYGINESKQPEYSSVEYHKVAADGKLYGIIREGAKYYIKVAKDAKAKIVAENFDYIGGFRNRKDNVFESFASAQRYFGEKMIALNENADNAQKRVIAEAWNLDEKKEVIAEGTRKMQAEIARQRQIMMNAQNINEGKKQCCDMPGCECAKEEKAEEIKKCPSAPFVNVPAENTDNEKGNIKGGKKKPVKESSEIPLSSRKNPDYMDMSKGTKIGNSAPFGVSVEDTKDAVADDKGGESEKPEVETPVNEGESMHDADNQNTPKVGTSEKGDTAPFDRKVTVTESLDDLDDELEDDVDGDELDTDFDVEDVDDEDMAFDEDEVDGEDLEDADFDGEDELDGPVDGDEITDEVGCDDVAARIDSLEAKLDSILAVINNMKYDDDEALYDDDSKDGMEDGDDFDDEDDFSTEDDEEEEVVESKSYRKMKKVNEENRLDVFGKHPAYQKKVMTLPSNEHPEKEGYYDMNDDSVKSTAPYGTQKGKTAPFDNNVEAVENAITEAVMKILKKKLD